MKKSGVIIIAGVFALLLTVGLTACGNGEDTETPVQNDPAQNEIGEIVYEREPNREWFENYTYRRRSVPLPDMDYRLQRTLIQGGTVYFCFTDPSAVNPLIVIIGVPTDGGEVSRVELPLNSEYIQIIGFDFTNDGNIAVFAVEFDEEYEEVLSAFYAEYDAGGRELFRRDFSDVFTPLTGNFEIDQAIFTEYGNIGVSVWKGFGTELYMLNTDSADYFTIETSGRIFGGGMVRLCDGRILVIESFPSFSLREVNIEDEELGESFPFAGRSQYSLFPASSSLMFDFLASDGLYLHGYSVETSEQIVLLNLAEMGFRSLINAYQSSGGELIALSGTWENNEMTYELFVLSPVSRDEPDGRTVITIGQIAAPIETFPFLVSGFNNESDTHRIEVIDFMGDMIEGDFGENVRGAIMRLQIEIMTGGGPDIIYMPAGFIANHELMVDLYPLIDADPELSRSDFLPNMLAALESHDNTLRFIAEYFTLRTIIGLPEAVGHIEQWTPSELLRFVQQTYETYYPFSPNLSAEWLLWMMLSYSGADLIDWYRMEANLDSDAFIEILETAKIIEGLTYRGGGMWAPSPDELMARGEQLLDVSSFFGWGIYRHHLTTLGDFEVLGIPTVDGGENVLMPFMQIGINAASENIDGAWEFLRSLLLPDGIMRQTLTDGTIPYRVDIFEGILSDISTPRMEYDEDGNVVEAPQSEVWLTRDDGGWDIVNVYAITPEQADRFRNIVENAVPFRGQQIYGGLWSIIASDLARFLAGDATAEETARIMQSRISIYLAEQS